MDVREMLGGWVLSAYITKATWIWKEWNWTQRNTKQMICIGYTRQSVIWKHSFREHITEGAPSSRHIWTSTVSVSTAAWRAIRYSCAWPELSLHLVACCVKSISISGNSMKRKNHLYGLRPQLPLWRVSLLQWTRQQCCKTVFWRISAKYQHISGHREDRWLHALPSCGIRAIHVVFLMPDTFW